MTKRLLLGSGGFRTPERRELLIRHMKDLFSGVDRVLFVPYALADHDGYLETMSERAAAAGLTLEGIHHCTDPAAAVRNASGIYVGGGNSFRLLDTLQKLGLVQVIKLAVEDGLPYMGVSAGSNVACPTLMTTNDMPIVQPASFEALGLVPFQINPHYFPGPVHVEEDGDFKPHFGETRDQRIAEYLEMNSTPVLGLPEGSLLRVEGTDARLAGGPGRLFRAGRDPVDLPPDTRVWPLE